MANQPEQLTQAEYKRLKTRLTRCYNKRDENPEALLKECTEALAYFATAGYPDDWSRWERAKEDAESSIRCKQRH